MIINVVGTQFNVTAYDEDTDYSVVLVEGCVDVSIDKEKARLLPNQMLSVSTDQISVKKNRCQQLYKLERRIPPICK